MTACVTSLANSPSVSVLLSDVSSQSRPGRRDDNYALYTDLPYSSFKANMSCVDGWAVNIWHVCNFEKERLCWRLSHQHVTCFCFKIFSFHKLVVCWWLSRQHMTSLKGVICWQLSHQHMTILYFHILKFKYFETKTCHMLTAQPSTYQFFFLNANMSYVDGSAINIWHVCFDRAIWYKSTEC